MDWIDTDLEEILQKRWAKAKLAEEALTYSNQNSRITMEIFLLESREEIDPLLVQRAQNTEKISSLRQQLIEQVESEKERGLLDAVDAARWPYINSYRQALHLLIDEQKPAEARAAMVKVTLPLLKSYHNAWNAFVQFQGKQMNEELEKEVAERKRAEGQLRVQAAALQSASYAIIITDRSGNIVWVNPAFTAMTGYPLDEALGGNPRVLCFRQQPQSLYETMWNTISAGQVWHGEMINRRKDGRLYTEEQTITPVRNQRGEITHFVAIKEDITERKELEQQFRQAQKMEAVGRLAGGVAHDFNNLLTIIKGHSELLRDRTSPGDPLHRSGEQIHKAAERAASLTHQLLAFSRMQVLQTKVLDLNSIVNEMGKMLPRLLREDIEFVFKPDPALGRVKADSGQIEQILMNLAVNARDAMPQGGKLTVETANVVLDEEYARRHPPTIAGRYVMLAVRDTGVGMDKETQTHIFEPFFTTKEQGKGTGLGLATVYGVVKQSGGFIWVESEPAQGATFKIYLPQVDKPVETAQPGRVAAGRVRGTETVLLVEDEEDLRDLISTFLKDSGYTVLEARDGTEALRIAEQHLGPIHLLVTDMVMPKMGGQELAKRLTAHRPDLHVLYVSGYSEYNPGEQSSPDQGAFFLQKPFTRDALVQQAREVLDTKVFVKL